MSILLEYLGVPHERTVDAAGTTKARVPGGRGALVWVAAAAPPVPPERRLARCRIFAPTMTDAEVLAATGTHGWSRTTPVRDAAGSVVGHVWRSDTGDVFLPFDPDVALLSLWSERYAAGAPAAGLKRAAMRAYYRLRPALPRAVQIALRRRFASIQARTAFPRWPVETAAHDLFDLILTLLGDATGAPVPWLAPWPEPFRWVLVLTHDVEHGVGRDNIALLRDIEEARGFRSAWNFVPRRYETPPATIEDLQARGHEVGVHGLYHDGRDLESRELLDERLPAIRAAADGWGATGFRSPATHRSWELMPLLGFDYDSSYLDTDPFEPQGGGSCTWWPFPIGDLVELPITLLMDHTLFVILRGDETIWEEKSRFLREREGMALLITHPDYMLDPSRLEVYDRFLATFEGDVTVWRALPRDVAAWWRQRAASAIVADGDGWRVEGPAAADARILLGPAAC